MLYDPRWERPAVDEIGKIMFAAADLIERDGHCKKMMFDGHGYCILGAIRWALRGSQYPANQYDAIAQRINLAAGGVPSIANWNDTHTKTEAIALLRKAGQK